MQIERVYIEHFRNLTALNLLPHPTFNFVWGDNGSGKSSFIEALYFMGHGRSFRSHKLHHIVQNEQDAFNVFVQCERDKQSIPLGVMRSRTGGSENKINQMNVATSLEVAKHLPMLALSPESLLMRGAKERARLFDWGVFHYDPIFEVQWRECRKIICQRNALLKRRAPYAQLQPWDQMLMKVADSLSSMRQAFIDKLMPYFKASRELLLPEFDVHIHYHQGWSSQKDICSMLEQNYDQDVALGYTQYGPHRVDYRFKLGHKHAVDVLSRGQHKLLICSIKLAMAEYYKSVAGTPALLLLDDLASEVDPSNRDKILQAIINLESQVFITSISQDFLVECMANQDYAQFHLDQGQLVD